VPCITYADALALREKCTTPILKQVRSDVTRFRYGDEQHLDEALQRIFQYGLVILHSVHLHEINMFLLYSYRLFSKFS